MWDVHALRDTQEVAVVMFVSIIRVILKILNPYWLGYMTAPNF